MWGKFFLSSIGNNFFDAEYLVTWSKLFSGMIYFWFPVSFVKPVTISWQWGSFITGTIFKRKYENKKSIKFELIDAPRWYMYVSRGKKWIRYYHYSRLFFEKSENIRFKNIIFLWFLVKPYANDIRMTHKYIRVTYGWHTSTYEWHTDDIRVHTSDIRMTYEWRMDDIRLHQSDIRMTCECTKMIYEHIGVTYEWHTSTYEWHTNDIRVHTSDIRMTCEYVWVAYGWHTSTYEWHTDDIRVHTSDIRLRRVIHTTYDIRRVSERLRLVFSPFSFQIIFTSISCYN